MQGMKPFTLRELFWVVTVLAYSFALGKALATEQQVLFSVLFWGGLAFPPILKRLLNRFKKSHY